MGDDYGNICDDRYGYDQHEVIFGKGQNDKRRAEAIRRGARRRRGASPSNT